MKKTIEFSLAVIEYAELLEQQRKYVIGKQLLRSGTSIGANVHEAQNAETKAVSFTNSKSLLRKEKKQSMG